MEPKTKPEPLESKTFLITTKETFKSFLLLFEEVAFFDEIINMNNLENAI
jgi:hypothetical protein